MQRSQISAVLTLIGRLPGELVIKRPWLSICNAWASLLGGQLNKVEAALQAAEMGVDKAVVPPGETAAEHSARIRGHSLAIRAYIASAMGDAARSIELSLQAAKELPPHETTARSANALNLGSSFFMAGDVVNASRYSKEAWEIASSGSNLYVAITAICSSGGVQMEQGRLQQAHETFERAVKLGKEWGGGHPLPATAAAYNGLAHLHYEWNHLDTALSFVEQGITLAESAHLWYSEYQGDEILARIRQAHGENEAAMAVVEKMRTKYPPGTGRGPYVESLKGRLLLARNDISALRRWLSGSEEISEISVIPEYQNEMPFLVLARAHIALGEIVRIPELLLRLCERAESQGRINNVIEILVIRALSLMTGGNNGEAVLSLDRALSLAEPEGYVRTFIDHGPALQSLLRQAARTSSAKDYIHRLLDAFPSPASDTSGAVPPEPSRSEHLNQREQEILRLIAAGLSNPEIAGRLCLSLNTIKWHTRNLYGKLGVTGRAGAVNRARDLNLL